MEIVATLITAYAAIWAFYVVLIPLLAFSRHREVAVVRPHGDSPAIAVIVPAHNMQAVIVRCIESLQACDYPRQRLGIYVAADHCTDDTRERADSAGAHVLVRNDGPPGKTYTLAWAVDELNGLDVRPDLYLVVDATVRVDPDFLGALVDKWREGEKIIVSHPRVDAENQRWFAQCLGLTLVHRNLQNRSRERLRLSAFVEGRGMAYSRGYIERFGWRLARPSSIRAGSHPTEDWRHGVNAVAHGYRVSFADRATLATPLRDSLAAATQQGIRWERGRMANAGTHALALLWTGLLQRSTRMVLAALDAIQPPVAVLAGLCLLVAVLSVSLWGWSVAGVLGVVPLFLVGLYALAVIAQGRHEGIRARTVLWAPVYVAWRCAAFLLAFLDRLRPARRGGVETSPEGSSDGMQ